MSLTKNTFKGFFWLSGGSGIQSIISIGVLALLARLITPEDFGIAQVALIVIGFSNLLSQLGVGPAIVQRKNLTANHVRMAFTLSLFTGATLGVLVFLLSNFIAGFFNMPELSKVLKVISIMFVIESFVVVSRSLLQRKMRLKQYAISGFLSYLLGYGVVSIIFAFLDYGVWALIYGSIAQIIIHSILVSILEPHSIIPFYGKKELNELLYFGGGFTIAKFANYLAGQGDNIVIGKMLGADSLGIYSRAYSIMVKPVSLIGTSLDKAIFPAMASVQDDLKKLESAFLKGTSLIALISIPLSLIFFISAPEIINVLLGNNWNLAIIPFQILSLGLVFRMGYKMSDSLARAKGAVYRRAWRQIIFAGLVLIGAYIGSFYGINGVSIAIVIAIFSNYLLMTQLSLSLSSTTWSKFINAHSKGLLNALVLTPIYFTTIYLCRIVISVEIINLILSLF